jgi:hypothetical protein
LNDKDDGMNARPHSFPPPWIFGTVDDKQAVLNADVTDVSVICEGHEGLRGDEFVFRWGVTPPGSPLSEFSTDKITLSRNYMPVSFTIPIAEVRARPGDIALDYEVSQPSGKIYSEGVHLHVNVIDRLEPVEVVQSADGDTIALVDVPDGATMRVANQSDLIPAGSTLTFEWEGTDGDQQPVRGTAVGYADGHAPTEQTLPLADLQRLMSVAIRYRVETRDRSTPLVGRRASFDSEWRRYRVVAPVEAWPAPFVIELTGDTLVPVAVGDGAHCRIEADLVATDAVTVFFGDFVTAPNKGARPLTVLVPAGEIAARLNRRLDVCYSVQRGGNITGSETLPIHIGGFGVDDPQLPQPRMDAEDGDTIDLGRFTGTPHVLVAPWLLIDPRQTVWLTATGERQDGTREELNLLNGVEVDPRWISVGIEAPVERELLQAFRDRSSLVLTCRVNFAGGDMAGAVTFRTRTYTLRNGRVPAPGRAWEAEDFEGMVPLIGQRDVRLRWSTVRQLTSNLYVGPGNASPFVEHSAPHWIEAGAHTEITLDRPAAGIRLGLSPLGIGFPTQVIALDDDGSRLATAQRDTAGWIDLRDGVGNRLVSRIELWTTGDGLAFFDNLLAETGEAWRIEAEPVLESFDDIAPGRYGSRLEFATWTITADRADIEVEVAPGGMVGQALAIHMNPIGRVHHFTPRFGSRPVQSVDVKMRGSASRSYLATVSVAYFNLDDHVLRTVSKRVSVQAATQLVSFNSPAELPRANELLSHIRVTHDNDSLPVTVFYDDISIY